MSAMGELAQFSSHTTAMFSIPFCASDFGICKAHKNNCIYEKGRKRKESRRMNCKSIRCRLHVRAPNTRIVQVQGTCSLRYDVIKVIIVARVDAFAPQVAKAVEASCCTAALPVENKLMGLIAHLERIPAGICARTKRLCETS